MRPSGLKSARVRSIMAAAACALLCSGCAVYPGPPVVYADGSPAAVPAPGTLYPVAPSPCLYYPCSYAPYYVGPPVSLDLWFGRSYGHHRGWAPGHYHRGWHGPRGFHGGRGGRRR